MTSICLNCGEDKEFNISVHKISNKEIELTLECKNCLSKLIIEGKYWFVKGVARA